MSGLLDSGDLPAIDWADTPRYAQEYGVKAAGALAIPRPWSLPFLLIPFDHAADLASGVMPDGLTGLPGAARLAELAGDARQLMVRSSVIGESIWDRGTYESVRFAIDAEGSASAGRLVEASERILASTSGRPTGLMLQRYVPPASQGEFGNLLRVSKTRDHWEIATREADEVTSREGVYIAAVTAGSPAATAGLKPGMVITSVNAIPLAGMGEAMGKVVDAAGPGATVTLIGGTTIKLGGGK